MQIKFLGQGFESVSEFSVGNTLLKLFSDYDFHTFTGILAFASLSGVNGLLKIVENAKHLSQVKIVTGIDQKGTSKEALEALLSSEKINSYIFYQPSHTIFHPKVYLFEGKHKSELIIGSSNLTSHGFFTNVEASMIVSIDNSIDSDKEIICQLKDYFKGIFDNTDLNLKSLSQELINELVNANIVPLEEERKIVQDKVDKILEIETKKIISRIFPKRAIPKIPIEFIKSRSKKTTKAKSDVVDKNIIEAELVWESGKLTERDLNIPKGTNTNATGSMLFKKGLTENIDQRHYFRENVFNLLEWNQDTNPNKSHIERAFATFYIQVENSKPKPYQLTINHNTRIDSKSYLQNNSMTSISWGKAKELIANEHLIGKTAKLYQIQGKEDEFLFIIE